MHYIGRDMRWITGFSKNLPEKASGARILVYHGICRQDPLRYNTIFLSKNTFEKQLQLFKKHFNIISLDDFYRGQFPADRFSVCLSFDDGFANNHDYVLPLLEQYQVSAAFFITAIREARYTVLWNDVLSLANVHGPAKIVLAKQEFRKDQKGRYRSSDTRQLWSDNLRSSGFEEKAKMCELLFPYISKTNEEYWMQMTEEQIRNLSQSKWVTIGSHGYYHNDLALIPFQDAKVEMIRSRQYLERVTAKEIKAIAFPYGSYTMQLIAEAGNAGFFQLLATDFLQPADAGNTRLRERLIINPFISVYNQLHAAITGNYDQ